MIPVTIQGFTIVFDEADIEYDSIQSLHYKILSIPNAYEVDGPQVNGTVAVTFQCGMTPNTIHMYVRTAIVQLRTILKERK